jgi:hypothetical protein
MEEIVEAIVVKDAARILTVAEARARAEEMNHERDASEQAQIDLYMNILVDMYNKQLILAVQQKKTWFEIRLSTPIPPSISADVLISFIQMVKRTNHHKVEIRYNARSVPTGFYISM